MTRAVRRAAAIAVALLLLAGCERPHYAPTQCPAVKPYSEAELAAIQKAIDALPANDPLRGAMQDYEELRDDARNCSEILLHGD